MPFLDTPHFFDKRFLEWDGQRNQVPTKNKRFIWVDAYARWQIVDPLLFYKRLRNERGAHSRLDDIIDGETRNVIAGAYHCYIKLPKVLFDNDLSDLGEEKVMIRIDTAPHNFKYILDKKILNKFPELEIIKVNKDYPNKIEIEFYEYPLIANIINESNSLKKSYIVNTIGYTVKEDYENPALPYIKIKSEEPLNTDAAIISVNKLNYILDIIPYFEDKFWP